MHCTNRGAESLPMAGSPGGSLSWRTVRAHVRIRPCTARVPAALGTFVTSRWVLLRGRILEINTIVLPASQSLCGAVCGWRGVALPGARPRWPVAPAPCPWTLPHTGTPSALPIDLHGVLPSCPPFQSTWFYMLSCFFGFVFNYYFLILRESVAGGGGSQAASTCPRRARCGD